MKNAHYTLAAAACGLVISSGAFAQSWRTLTNEVALVEDFGATWCSPCVSAYHAMDRLKQRWGNQVAINMYSVADELDNSYNSRRESEEGIVAIPTFVFQGSRQQVGTPGDSTLDNWVQEALDQPRSARIIGRYTLDEVNELVNVAFKIEGYNDTIDPSWQLRVVVHENHWSYPWLGLPGYDYHVQDGFDIEIEAPIQHAEQVVFIEQYSLAGNQYIHDWAELGVTLYLYDPSSRTAKAAWELGQNHAGDLDGNLRLDQNDVRLFRDQIGKQLWQEDFNPAADWNSDGQITLADRDLGLEYVQGGGMR